MGTADPVVELVIASIESIAREADEAIDAATSSSALDKVAKDVLGKRGRLKELQQTLGELPQHARPEAGRSIQEATSRISSRIEAARARFDAPAASPPAFDLTLPGVDWTEGGLHPTVQMMYDLNDAFGALNFDVFAGPEITSERYEFDSLNFPPDHPARESMDTFWLTQSQGRSGPARLCLRPHLTGASVRYMRSHEPPFRCVYPGRVYRNESTDARHERAFFQYEALMVDRKMPLSAGKLLVSTILDTVFGRPVETRMRVGYFPFVEPGFEIDMKCQVCAGSGCSVCKHVGWLEVMPGGVPHPNVLRASGLSPDDWTGFYINVGLDRLVMMRYGIDDVRLFNSGDLRFLSQFA